MTEREKFAKEYSLHAGIPFESVKFDDYGTPCIDTPYVTNVIHNAMVQAAYWGWQAAKAQQEEDKFVDVIVSEYNKMPSSVSFKAGIRAAYRKLKGGE